LRSLQRLFAIDPGFAASHVLTMQVQTAGRKFDKATTDRFFERSLEAVRALPGVEAAAYTSQLPLSGDDDEYGAHFEFDKPTAGYNVFRYAVSPGYFETLRIPLERGRLLDKRDSADRPRAVVISEALARRKFANRDPIGQRVHIGPTDQPWYTIVGVVGDIKQASLAASQPDAVYITPAQSWFVDSALSLVVRASADRRTMTPAIKQAVWSIDKDQPIVRVATMDELVARTAADRRFALILFELFGIVALALAATGIYGVVSGGVAERVKEIGVRAALGASRRSIQGLILRQGMVLTAAGLVLGLAGSVAAGRVLLTLLFGITPLDPLTYASVTALLLTVSAVACWLPAWRAARVDPCTALRSE
jgi:putative ABC transport system permease protein